MNRAARHTGTTAREGRTHAATLWSGSISFGLVNVPVKLFNAVNRKTVRFNQIDSETQSRIRLKKVSAETGEEVPNERLVKGYEISKENYVVLNEDELAALDPEAQRTIDIQEFVDLDEIDPIYYDSAYYLAPDGEGVARPYALLAEAMGNASKVAIARFVMRNKEYLAAIRPKDGVLVLSTMVYPDEVNGTDDIPELDPVTDVELPEKELQMAEALIDSLAANFEADKFHDTHREQVLELIDRKAAGEEDVVLAAEAPEPKKVVDLMAALEASVKEAKESRQRHPSTKDGGAAKKKPAKKKAPKKAAKKKSA